MFELLNELLYNLSDEIDITDSQKGAIERAYNSVADWLNKPNTLISKHKVNIFPQGSMRYGTAIKPINEDDYDVDLVCELTSMTDGLSPEYVKKQVGARLKEHETYNRMLEPEEGRRCWTLQYSDNFNFHMDILPSIPFSESYRSNYPYNKYFENINIKRDLALLATDKDKKTAKYSYIPTNPKGFAEWFKERMRVNTKKILMDSVERLPDYPQKTILQRSIQLLKRHRDVYFADKDDSLKPISMIITTLAAKCYNGQQDIYSFIQFALSNMGSLIERGNHGEYVIKNPVMEKENFADKWKEVPEKADAFFDWIRQAKSDFETLAKYNKYTEFDIEFKRMFSQKPVDRLMRRYEKYLKEEREVAATKEEYDSRDLSTLEKIPHRKPAPWILPKGYKVAIEGNVSYDGGKTYSQFKSGQILPKKAHLKFFPLHSIKPPYVVKWQITNTGDEARRENCLRGNKFESGEIERFGICSGKKEITSYKGTHYVQCFIIKNGTSCEGVSLPFVVRVQ